MKATSSLRLSLAAKPNDNFTLIFPTRDSVTFSTARYRFDINRISAARCISRQPIQRGLTQLRYLGHKTWFGYYRQPLRVAERVLRTSKSHSTTKPLQQQLLS